MKRIFFAICIVLSIGMLCSCEHIEENEAKAFAQEYSSLLEEGNYEELIPKTYIPGKDVTAELERLESESGLDFQSGIEITEYTSFETRHSDSYYGLPVCELKMQADIGKTVTTVEVSILDDDGTLKVCAIYIYLNGECHEMH